MTLIEEHKDEFCPDCGVGCLKIVHKPYLQLFLGQLFTIPNAVCYQCDVCRYSEFDEVNFDMISDMMFGARLQANDDKTRPVTTLPDDSTAPQQKPPHI